MRKRVLAAIAVVFLICVLVASKLDRFLAYQDEPEAVDLLVVLGGSLGSRIEKGLELYKQGYAPVLLLTGFNMGNAEIRQLYVDLFKGYLLKNGVAEDRIYLDYLSKGTHEEALNTCTFMEGKRFRSVIIISDPYHMRRVKYCFDRACKGKGMRLLYISSDLEWVQGAWWKDKGDLLVVFNEMIKWVYYLWNY